MGRLEMRTKLNARLEQELLKYLHDQTLEEEQQVTNRTDDQKECEDEGANCETASSPASRSAPLTSPAHFNRLANAGEPLTASSLQSHVAEDLPQEVKSSLQLETRGLKTTPGERSSSDDSFQDNTDGETSPRNDSGS